MAHDDIIERAVAARQSANEEQITAAFVGSLTRKGLPARSAFGSLAVVCRLAAHDFTPSRCFHPTRCEICGLTADAEAENRPERVANYPFQVQHTDLVYACFDLETFAHRSVQAPNGDDVGALRDLLDNLRALPPEAELSELLKSMPKAIKSNKHQRMILLETLGYAGVLQPSSKPGYARQFVTYDHANSDQPAQYNKREWAYPIRFWTGRDGVDEDRVQQLFGRWL